MTCQKCGNQLADGLGFCPICGAQVYNEAGEENSEFTMPVVHLDELIADEKPEAVKEPVTQDSFDFAAEEAAITSQSSIEPQPISPTGIGQSEYGFDQPQSGGGRRSSKKPIIIGVIAAILLLASFGAYAKTSYMFMSPKEIYLEVEGKNMLKSLEEVRKDYKENYDKKVKPLMEKAYESKVEYSANADLSGVKGMDPAAASKVSKILGGSKLILDSKVNPNTNKGISDISLFVQGNRMFDLSLVQDNTKVALSAPVLYKKYLVLDINDMNGFMRKLGVPNPEDNKIPKKFVNNNDILKAVKFDEEKALNVIKGYGRVIEFSIDEKQVTMEKGVEFKVNDLSFKTRKLTITMSEEELKNMLLSLAEKAEKDDELYDLTVQNIINVMKVYKDAGYPATFNGKKDFEAELSKEKFRKGINDLKSEINKMFEEVEFPEGIKMSIYVDGDKIVGRTIEAKTKDAKTSEDVSFKMTLSGVSNYKKKNISNIELSVKDSKDEVIFKGGYDTTIGKKDSEAGKANMTVDVIGKDSPGNVFKADIDIKIDGEDKDSKKYLYKYDITGGETKEEKFMAKGTLDIELWEKEKEKQDGSDINFSIDAASVEAKDKKFSGSITMSMENTKDITFTLPNFDSSNSIDVGKADRAELSTIMREIGASAQRFMLENRELMKLMN